MRIKLSGFAKAAVVLAFVTFLAACAGRSFQHPNQPVTPIGSTIHLNITADVPLDDNSVYIQNQMIVSAAQIDKYQVYCSVVMDKYQQSAEPQLKIVPGEFTVLRVRLYNDYVHNPTIYANTDDRFYYPSTGIDFRTEIHLKSSNQPEIHALTCTNHSAHYKQAGYYPERPQFEAQLGDFAKLP